MLLPRITGQIEGGLQAVPRRVNRALHGCAAALLALALICCALLKPDPSGRGTHRQLGLPSCLVCKVAGMERCPSCGLTTAFAHTMRGNLEAARQCNAAAPLVLVLWLTGLVYAAAIAVTGRQWLCYELPALLGVSVAVLIWWIHRLLSL